MTSARIKKVGVGLIVILLLGFAGMWELCRWLEWANLYSLANHQMVGKPSDKGIAYEDVWMIAADGVRLHGWWIPAKDHPSQRPTILFCHGSGGNISYWVQKSAGLQSLEVNQFLFDYRGYGQSEGHPTEKGTYLDAEAAYHYLVDTRKISVSSLVIYGESLGGAVAIDLASRVPAAALIVDGTFTSSIAMANVFFPHLPSQWTIRYRYDSLSKVPRIHVPVLQLHNPHDGVVPLRMAQHLFATFNTPKVMSPFTGTHTQNFNQEKEYLKAIDTFLNTVPGLRHEF